MHRQRKPPPPPVLPSLSARAAARLAALLCTLWLAAGEALPAGTDAVTPPTPPAATWDGWSLAFDNDSFSPTNGDRDYTGGLALTVSGRPARDFPLPLDAALDWLEPLVPDGPKARHVPALQGGLLAFTPETLSAGDPVAGERPYASLVFLAAGRTYVPPAGSAAHDLTLTVGALGLDAAETVQRAVHDRFNGSQAPQGWEHQISEGGEPTLRLTLGRQALLAGGTDAGGRRHEVKWRLQAGAGYLTDIGIALSARWGRIQTPWWSFAPERSDYITQPLPVVGGGGRELYLWAGAQARLRAYNALLEGQFRDSPAALPGSRVETLIGEAWAGVTWQVSRRLRLSYVLRYQTPEIAGGRADRRLIWGGLVLSHTL